MRVAFEFQAKQCLLRNGMHSPRRKTDFLFESGDGNIGSIRHCWRKLHFRQRGNLGKSEGSFGKATASFPSLPRRTHPTSFQEFSMVQPTRSPNTRLVFIARNLSSIEALRGMSVVSLPQSFRIGMSLNLKSTVDRKTADFLGGPKLG